MLYRGYRECQRRANHNYIALLPPSQALRLSRSLSGDPYLGRRVADSGPMSLETLGPRRLKRLALAIP